MDRQNIARLVEKHWAESILATLHEYIKIPNKSPLFDPDWQAKGHMDRAIDLVAAWCRKQAIRNMRLEVLRLPQKTPLLFIEIPGQLDKTVLLYGHLDKQPEMQGWDKDKGPWQPVLLGDKLYGRGAADDGYAVFASLAAIAALQEEGLPHGRCVLLIEASEESGSCDLPAYLESLSAKIGQPELVVCLDSGCGDYETLWTTTSLRGLVSGELHLRILHEGIHSGLGSGVVPSWYHVLQKLLARIEDPETGAVLAEAFRVSIPSSSKRQAREAAALLGEGFSGKFPFAPGVRPMAEEIDELLLNQSWKPALTVTGLDGVPGMRDAGNVSLPQVAVKLSLRLPPTCEGEKAVQALKSILEADPPYGVEVELKHGECGSGWHAPEVAPWLHTALDAASQAFFGRKVAFMGEGGSIPFMAMLGKKYPNAQFVITGVLGPKSNAHGPNEFLHLPTAKKITACVASLLYDHYQHFKGA